jgi:universal stress protein A
VPGFRSILCAVDFSPASRRALEEAADLARRTGTSLALAHVEPGPPARDEALFAPPPRPVKREPGAAAALDAWARDAEGLVGRPIGKMLLAGKPAQEILRAADVGSFELVVVGTHGRTGIAHAVLGSIAEHVARHARVPVLVVPAK